MPTENNQSNRRLSRYINQDFPFGGRLHKNSVLRWSMISLFIMLMAIILPKDFVPEFNYELGKVWVAPELKADFSFPIYKPLAQYEDEKKIAINSSPPVFRLDTTISKAVEANCLKATEGFFVELQSFRSMVEAGDPAQEDLRKRLQNQFGFDPDLSTVGHRDLRYWQETFSSKVSAFVKEVYQSGLADTTKSDLRTKVIFVRKSQNIMIQKSLVMSVAELPNYLEVTAPGLDAVEKRLIKTMILPLLRPDMIFDPSGTAAEQKRALGLVSPVEDKVAKGEAIISKGEPVTEMHDRKITSYFRARNERFGRTPYLITLSGQIALVTIVTMLLVLFMRNNRPRVFFSFRKLGLVLMLFLFMVGIVVLVLKLTVLTQEITGLNYIYLAPACMVPIILSAFFDSRFAFFGNLIVAVFAGAIIPNGFEYFFIQLCGGTAAVYSTTKLRNRGDFFISLSLIFLAYVLGYIGYKFYTRGSFASIEYINLLLFGLNVLLTFITYPLIYVFERIFGLTSDLTYIELLDTNHPLLKDLAVKAPGTFQHSLQVANLAEAVLNKIGGNSLQAKVGGLFHDIGKMLNPSFFIENLGDKQNPHDGNSYQLSSEVIIRHVSDGVKLAHEYNLPDEIIDFIKTHHGTTRTEYFYRKYVDENPEEEVDPLRFQYPGPLPFTRETAVLMIVDSIEAAARSMKDHSPEKLLSLVEGIVDGKVRQRQFDKANLTFKDLEDAKQVIFAMLSSMYHGRIEYPEEIKLAEDEANSIESQSAEGSE